MSDSFRTTEACKTSATSSETHRLFAETSGRDWSVTAGVRAEDWCCLQEEEDGDEEEGER